MPMPMNARRWKMHIGHGSTPICELLVDRVREQQRADDKAGEVLRAERPGERIRIHGVDAAGYRKNRMAIMP